MRRRGFFIMAIFISVLTGFVRAETEPPTQLTLEDAVRIAYENNLDIELAELSVRALQSRYKEILGTGIPDITLSGSYTNNFNRPVAFFSGNKIEVGQWKAFEASAELEQIVFSGGRFIAGRRSTKASLEAGKMDLRATKEEVELAVKKLFYSVLLASETVAIQQDNLRSTQEHLDTVTERYKQGLDSDLIVMRQNVEVANAKTALIQAKNFYEISLVNFLDLLYLDVDKPVSLVGSLDMKNVPVLTYEKMVQQAFESRPEILSARKRTEAALSFSNVIRGDMFPELTLFANSRWLAQSSDFTIDGNEQATASSGGLRLKYPIFTGGENWQKYQQAKIGHEKAVQQEEKIKRSVRTEVKQNWLALHEAEDRAAAQEAAIQQSKRALEVTEVRYRAGQSSQLELNDTTFSVNRTRLVYVLALHDYWLSLARLDRAVGAPIKEDGTK